MFMVLIYNLVYMYIKNMDVFYKFICIYVKNVFKISVFIVIYMFFNVLMYMLNFIDIYFIN